MAKVIVLDESGNAANAPITVVAATIVDAAWQLNPALIHLRQVRQALSGDPENPKVLHASDIFSNKKLPVGCSVESRRVAMNMFMGSFPALHLPFVLAYRHRGAKAKGDWETKLRHATCFWFALKQANSLLRQLHPGEQATVVAEDCPQMRHILKDAVQDIAAVFGPAVVNQIRGPISFEEKTGSPFLQFADAAAFGVRRFLSHLAFGEELVSHLNPHWDWERWRKKVSSMKPGEAGEIALGYKRLAKVRLMHRPEL